MADLPKIFYGKDFEPGKKFMSMGRTIGESDVMAFAGLSGDNTSLHTNAQAMAQSQFGGRLAHGMLVASIATGLQHRMGLTEGAIAALSTEWKFTGPVMFGDTIRCEIGILEAKRSNSKPDRGMIRFSFRVLNQKDVLCQEGSLTAMYWWEGPPK
ncbi:MAG: dehydratase [Deltaproteobacteria bacterium]|jgi:acyl dehydratase|nr:dehydratase [Deltaproteobacteria bacterium]